ncbi:MAG: hypothetical protein KC777_11235 [Cyanobacteria bacterium HKST-UBA02]|nr:hypothetical protein [Cyanobacteria bacterium HKST-UBA02]
MEKALEDPPHRIEPWREDLDATAFSSGMEKIDRYIKEQAPREMRNRLSLVFVLTEPESIIVRGFFSLSALAIRFADLPAKLQKRLPKYQQVSATLLGRLGVDRSYRSELQERLGENPRLGEFLFVDAQKRALEGATETVGSALMVIDVLMPTEEELVAGVRDPMTFYKEYGFLPFPGNDRRVFKPMRTIEEEYGRA